MRVQATYLFFYGFFVVLGFHLGQAQTSAPSALSQGNTVGLGYRQEFNSYLWTLNARFNQQVSNRLNVSFQEDLRTSMLRLGSQDDRWKDDQNAGMQLSYLLLPNLTLQGQMQTTVFLDKQSGFNNDVRSHFGILGAQYNPWPNVSTSLLMGPKWDSRYNQNDRGLNYGITFSADDINVQEYDNNLDVLLNEDIYDRRRNRNLMTTYRLSREFTDAAADSVELYFSNRRRDNYVSLLGDIESQREEVKGGRNDLFYGISENLSLKLRTLLEFKNVELRQYGETLEERRRKRNDQRFHNDLRLVLNRPKLQGQFDLSYRLQEQRYDLNVSSDRPFSARTAFITPDNSSSRLSFTSFLKSRFTVRDSASVYFSINRFQYDTPDTTNFDDRDELRINTRATFSHWFNPALKAELLASVNLYHMVYIFGERSADNNWNRIFLLRPMLEYEPSETFRLFQSFEVLANYVDYDFEDVNVTTRSFVFRKFAMTDSLRLKVLPHTWLLLDYRLQLEENGQLYWDAWSERIISTRTNQWIHGYWRYEPRPGIDINAGYTIYKRDEWRHNTDALGVTRIERAARYISQGPVLRVNYFPKPSLHVFVDATRYKVSVTNQEDNYINNIEFGFRWYF